MNYYAARQLKSGPNKGKWHFTCHNRRIGTFPVGYCSTWKDCPEDHHPLMGNGCATCGDKGVIENPDPCPGHDTAEEACEHARQYAVDHATYDHTFSGAKYECEAHDCDNFTEHAVKVGHPSGQMISLCGLHRNRETVDKLVEPFSQIASSY